MRQTKQARDPNVTTMKRARRNHPVDSQTSLRAWARQHFRSVDGVQLSPKLNEVVHGVG